MNKKLLLNLVLCLTLILGTGLVAGNSSLENKLKNIVIEHFEPENVSIKKAIEIIRQKARKADPEKKGINILLLLDEKEGSGKDDQDVIKPEDNLVRGIEVDLKFDNLQLGELLRNICLASNLQYRIDDYAVVIAGKNIPLDNLETAIWPIEIFCDDDQDPEKEGPRSVKDYFLKRGVSFPHGAKVVFDNVGFRLIAVNTPRNLKKIGQLVSEVNDLDPQVLIEAKYIKIPLKDYNKIKNSHSTSDNELTLWQKVLASEKTELIASSSVMTQNGEEATIRMVKEVYFPESWGYPTSVGANDVDVKDAEKQVIVKPATVVDSKVIEANIFPEFGEPTELGIRMTVTPTVDPDKYTVSLDAIPVIQQHIGWTYYKDSKIARMPILKANTTQTQTTSYDGEAIFVSSFMEDVFSTARKKRERNCFMLFYTARLVNPDGKPIRKIKGEPNPIVIEDVAIYVKRDKPISPYQKELSKMVIDKVQFVDADLAAVIKFLGKHCSANNGKTKFSLAISDKEMKKVPQITFDLNDIPCLEVIKYVSLISGLKFKFIDGVLTIGPASTLTYKTKNYSVRSGFINHITNQHNDCLCIDETSAPEAVRAIKKYFSDRGVSFSDDATLSFDKRLNELKIHNSPENLEKLDSLLGGMWWDPVDVIVESNCVAILEKDLQALLGKQVASAGVFSKAQIQKILNSEKGLILASQSVVSRSGEEATARTVAEEYFPETWTGGDVKIRQGHLQLEDALPEIGEATDSGARFIVTPTVAPNNYTISLALNPQRLKLVGLSEYDWEYRVDGKVKKEKIRLPKITRKDLTTNIRIYDGQTLCVARTRFRAFPELKGRSFPSSTSWTKLLEFSKSEGKELTNIFFFVSARVVKPDGKFMRRKIK